MGVAAKTFVGAIALLGVLAGCDEVGSVIRSFHIGERVQSAWDYAGSRGPILTQIHGNPFPRKGDAALAVRVTDHLAHAGQSRVTAYTTDPAQAFYPKTRLVLLFGAINVQADAVCDGRQVTGQQGVADKDIVLTMVLCNDGQGLAMTDGRIPLVDDLDDDSVGWLISHSLQIMLRN